MAQNLKSSLESGYRWWNGIEVTSSQYLIYSDTYTMGTSTLANSIPVAWSTPDLTDQNLLNLINTLPPRVGQTAFTSLPIALQWLQSSNKFFLIRGGTENIVKSGLKLYVDAGRFDSYIGNGTTWSDLSGNNNNGTLVNGTGYNSSGVGSMVFDGSDDYVNCGNGITTTTQITVSAWVKLNVNNIFQHIVDSANNTWHLAVLSDGRLYFWDGGVYHTNGPILSTGKWYHVVGVKTATTNDIYVNGILGSSLNSNVSVPTNNVWIGRWQPPGDGRIFNGNISNVQIYDTALSPQQILQNYNTQKLRFGYYDSVQDGLIFDLDAGNYLSYPRSGTTWTDLTGRGNNGDLLNGTTFSGGTTPSILFDGSDDYVRIFGSANYNWGNQITVNSWFYNRGTPSYRGIINNGYYYSCSFEQRLGRENNGTDINMIVRKDLSTSGNLNMSVLRDSWNMSTLTYDGTSVNGYVNGELKATTPLTGSIYTAPRDIVIGMRGLDAPGEFFDGNISNTQIYNRALSPQEIIQNFESQRVNYGITGITTNGLVLNLDAANNASYNGSGTVWKDISGSGFDGTLTNGPTYSNSGVTSNFIFDGGDDYVKSSQIFSGNMDNTNLTYTVWCYPTGASSGFGALVNQGQYNYEPAWMNNNSSFYLWYWDSTIIEANGLSPNKWYCVNVIKQGTTHTMTIYYDNTVFTQTVVVSKPNINWGDRNGDVNIYIGQNGVGEDYNGKISNVIIYNKALTSDEILQNYNATKSRFGL